MLGNRNDRQKQRNQIVFKLLKSMDPFLPSLNQHEDIRSQILKILKQNAYNIIPEQNSSDEQQIESLNLSRNHVENKKIARSLASKVFDVTVANGGWLNQQIQTKKKQLQIALSKQLQAQTQSKIVRKQIETIQNDVHKKFNINKKITGNSGNMINYYQSSTSNYPISNYSSMKYNSQAPIKNFNTNRTTQHSDSNKGLINLIPSSRSFYAQDQNYRILSGNQGNQRGYQSGWQSERYNQYSNDFQNEYSNMNGKDYKTVSYHNSNLHASNSKLTQITNKFTLLRSQLSHFQSPIKRYRHETDKLLSKNCQNIEQIINKDQSLVKSQLMLGLQSKISNKTNIFKSKSELILKKSDIKQERASKLQIFNNKRRSLNKKSTKIQKFLDQNPKIKLDISKLNKKVSQKTLKQSQKLDMQIMTSLLHRKMRDNDKSNTIASLIK